MRPSRLRALSIASVALALCAALAGACMENDARDSHCAPEREDSRCLYESDGRGVAIVEPACPPVDGDPGECPDFGAVRSMLNDPDRGNCSAIACHGSLGTAALGIYLPANSARDMYDELTSVRGSVGRPYVNADDPSQSWMLCNVSAHPGGGFPMPKPGGLGREQDVDLVRRWLLCGAPGP